MEDLQPPSGTNIRGILKHNSPQTQFQSLHTFGIIHILSQHGGQGDIWKAWDYTEGKMVAIKQSVWKETR